MSNQQNKPISLLLIPITIFLVILFCTFLGTGNSVAAEEGEHSQMQRYESILIRDGDTLSSISADYAEQYSSYSEQIYMQSIIELNDLSSEYIQAGNYILLPVYR